MPTLLYTVNEYSTVIAVWEHAQVEPVAEQNFGTAEFHRATECCKQALVIEERCCAEINEFDAEPFINDDVFIFDVTVYNAERVQVGQRRHQLHIQTTMCHCELLTATVT